jgi:hypothetical protein
MTPDVVIRRTEPGPLRQALRRRVAS